MHYSRYFSAKPMLVLRIGEIGTTVVTTSLLLSRWGQVLER